MRVDVKRIPMPAPPLPPGSLRLVLTGFMGSGKTAAGRRAADLLGLPFFDLDDVVERRARASILDILAIRGEAEFRRLEREAVADAARLSGAVVATGGGAVIDRSSFGSLAEDATVIVLAARPDVLRRRLDPASDRPLLRPDPDVQIDALLKDRAPAYASWGEPVDTSEMSPEEVGSEIARRYRSATSGKDAPTDIEVRAPDGPYPVVIGTGGIEAVGELVHSYCSGAARAVVVTDRSVERSVAMRVLDSLRKASLQAPDPIAVPGGEATKTVGTLAGLWEAFRALDLDRAGIVLAVGGGATLDAVGFAAATYARGVPLVNVPTTLLAMIDAGLGGKVGIDHAGVKNLAGTFHHPRLVVADPSTLRSVSPGAHRPGMAEAVKAGLLASSLLFEALETTVLDETGAPLDLPWIIEQCVRIKAGYVGVDPGDRSLRKSLNLGHTFAHAIESASDYRISHGDAVAMGLVAAAALGAALGITPAVVQDRLKDLLPRFGLPVGAPPLDRDELAGAMAGDKKREGGTASFVVPAPGGAELVVGVDPGLALSFLLPSEVTRVG